MHTVARLAGTALFLFGNFAGAETKSWTEEDFPPRAVQEYGFSDSASAESANTVVGGPIPYRFKKGDTLHDVARHLGLGINEVTNAIPNLDVWLPPFGEERHLPTWWILPDSQRKGVMINIPEMRLYYYPPKHRGVVITYPVGLGRDEWQTPIGPFAITEKTRNPTWVIPQSIRAEAYS